MIPKHPPKASNVCLHANSLRDAGYRWDDAYLDDTWHELVKVGSTVHLPGSLSMARDTRFIWTILYYVKTRPP
jgi:hypothetical protein